MQPGRVRVDVRHCASGRSLQQHMLCVMRRTIVGSSQENTPARLERVGMPAYSVSLRMHHTLTTAAVFVAEIAAEVAHFCGHLTVPQVAFPSGRKRLGCGPFLVCKIEKRQACSACVFQVALVCCAHVRKKKKRVLVRVDIYRRCKHVSCVSVRARQAVSKVLLRGLSEGPNQPSFSLVSFHASPSSSCRMRPRQSAGPGATARLDIL